MATIITRTLRVAQRREGDRLNIAVMPTHERYESMLARTGHAFWALQGPGLKTWDSRFAPVPSNYTILNPERGENQIPSDVTIDVIMSQSLDKQHTVAAHFARTMGVPHINLFHVLPHPQWGPKVLEEVRGMGGHINVCISEYSREAWGFQEHEAVVVEHGVDTAIFRPGPGYARAPLALSVVNQWEKRDVECGFNFWKRATEGLPTAVVGDNPGLSEPAGSVQELAFRYQTAACFVNTAQISPVPTTLLEAMACGCVPISTRNPMVESIITDGVNGYLADCPEEMREKIEHVLRRPYVTEVVGGKARETIEKRFSLGRFLDDWERVFRMADDVVIREVK